MPALFPSNKARGVYKVRIFPTHDGLYDLMGLTAGDLLAPIATFAWMDASLTSGVGMRVLGIKRFQNARLTF
jgi:hypothetical protein